jgi:hypothetical protein
MNPIKTLLSSETRSGSGLLFEKLSNSITGIGITTPQPTLKIFFCLYAKGIY